MAGAMGDWTVAVLLTLLLVTSWSLVAVKGSDHGRGKEGEEEEIPGGGAEGSSKGLFILGRFKKVVKTDEGEVKVVSGYRWKGDPSPMHIGFISMEPNTLFIPQYVDANLILFVRRGKVKIGWMCKDEMVERHLKTGDINLIPAGSTFYLVNTCEDERLHIIASIDSSESLGYTSYQSFFVGGGSYPTSVLAGFDPRTLTAALNITEQELGKMLRQTGGPIVHINNGEYGKHHDRGDEGKKETEFEGEEEEGEGGRALTWRKFLEYVTGMESRKRRPVRSPDSYNLYDGEPSFRNHYGWSTAVDENDYAPLKHSGVGVYLVNLTAGSMLAPHENPTATEYGIVLEGSGTIQVVFPNGSAAMNAEVKEGDVFWIPRYFPFCQVASRGEPMQFFGFTTSSRRNRPQFLAGASSVLRNMRGPELAAAFGVTEEQLERLVRAQKERVILPTPERERKEKEVKAEDVLVTRRKVFA